MLPVEFEVNSLCCWIVCGGTVVATPSVGCCALPTSCPAAFRVDAAVEVVFEIKTANSCGVGGGTAELRGEFLEDSACCACAIWSGVNRSDSNDARLAQSSMPAFAQVSYHWQARTKSGGVPWPFSYMYPRLSWAPMSP